MHKPKYVSNDCNNFKSEKPRIIRFLRSHGTLILNPTSRLQWYHTPSTTYSIQQPLQLTISKHFYLTNGTQCYKQTLCLQHHLAASSACFWAAVSLVALKCYTTSHYVYLCTCITVRSHSQNLNNSTPVMLQDHTGELFVWFQLLYMISCNSASWNYHCIWQRIYVITQNGNTIQTALDSAKILEFFRFCINSVPM